MEISQDWLQRARALDENVLTQVYRQTMPGLYRYAMRMLRDPALAEECVAEAFSRLIGAWQKGKGPERFVRAYLYRIAHNWVVDRSRRNGKTPYPLEWFEEYLEAPGGAAQEAEKNMKLEQVRAALRTLSPSQRQVIMLRYLEGWSNQEIAEKLETSIGAVKALRHRGVAALKRMLVQETKAVE